jgi:hypothetical protein
MGHRIPGSRENYFDRHDLEEVTARYKQRNFTRKVGRLPETPELMRDEIRRILREEGAELLREFAKQS